MCASGGGAERLPATCVVECVQGALLICVPDLLHLQPRYGLALPAELLPYAAAQLLPLLFLPPERVRALDPARLAPLVAADLVAADQVSDFLSRAVVRTRLPVALPLKDQQSSAVSAGVTRA